MTVTDFAQNFEQGRRVERLSEALYWGPPSEPRARGLPWCVEHTIIAVGLLSHDGKQRIAVYVDAGLSGLRPSVVRPVLDVRPSRQAIEAVFPGEEQQWTDAVAVGTPPVRLDIGRGDEISSPINQGTCGARVSWGNGRQGFLTAGHVARASHVVHDSNKSVVGTCVLSLDPLVTPSRTSDVAVVELQAGVSYGPAPAQQLGKTHPGQAIIIHSPRGPLATTVSGFLTFFVSAPPSSAVYDNVLQTAAQVTQGGDSGSLVTAATGEILATHVGSAQGYASFGQDLDTQLQAIRTHGAFANLSL